MVSDCWWSLLVGDPYLGWNTGDDRVIFNGQSYGRVERAMRAWCNPLKVGLWSSFGNSSAGGTQRWWKWWRNGGIGDILGHCQVRGATMLFVMGLLIFHWSSNETHNGKIWWQLFIHTWATLFRGQIKQTWALVTNQCMAFDLIFSGSTNSWKRLIS